MERLQRVKDHTLEGTAKVLLLIGIFLPGFAVSLISVTPNGTVDVTVNSSLTLMCSYANDAGDKFQITWRRGGRPQTITQENCTKLLEYSGLHATCPTQYQQNLTITLVDLSSHDTNWTCVNILYKENQPITTESRPTTIHVNVPVNGVVLTEPATNTVNVTEGSVEAFVCKTSPCRPSATVKWYKGGNTCDEKEIDSKINTTYTPAYNGLDHTQSTMKYNVTRADQGCQIYCRASNIGPSNILSTLKPTLIVWYAPSSGLPAIRNVSGNTSTLVEHMILNLTCDMEGGNPLATLTWNCINGTVSDESSSNKTIQRVTWRAERNKDGPCTCTAYHPAFSTSQSATINVEVLYPPSKPILSINSQERRGIVTVINNTKVPVICNSSSKPPPSYQWLYQNYSYTENMVTQQVMENSTLTCIATNTMTVNTGNTNKTKLGNSTSEISFHVLYGPTKPEIYCEHHITGETVDVIHGHGLTLSCSANGDPQPKYTWNEGAGNNITVNVTRDNLVYNCTASNELQPDYGNETSMSASSVIRVNRLYGPNTKPVIKYNYADGQSYTLTSRISVVENSSFSLTCNNSNGRPLPTYKWTGAGSSMSGFLDVSEIKRSPSVDVHGISYYQYTCIVQNEMMNTCGDRTPLISILNHEVTVNVLYPAVLEPHQNQSAEEGKDILLTATVAIHGSPRETYSWLYSKANTGSKTALAYNLTHTIQNISRTEAGFYTIEATNVIHPTGLQADNKTVSQTFYLDVFYTTTISNFTIGGQQGNTTYNENDTDIEVRCLVDSNPSSDIELFAKTYNSDGKIADKISTFTIVYTIPTATCFDTGRYRCIGHNNYTRTSVSSEAHIFVKCLTEQACGIDQLSDYRADCTPRPRYQVLQNITVYKALNDSVTLNLTVIAYPEPSPDQFYWEKINGTTTTNMTNGGNVNISVVNLEPRLTIYSLQQKDLGQYRLTISYDMSRSYSHYFFINPQDKPQAPTTFTHIQEIISATTAGFQWTPGFDGGLEQTFYVFYKKASDLLWNYVVVLTNTVTLKGLVPGTMYNVKVFASNSLGNSSETVTLNFTTKEEVRKSSPPIALIGGAAGGGAGLLLLVVIVLVVVFYRRTHRPKDCQGDQGRHSLCNDHVMYDENGMEINQAYESADSLGIQLPSTSHDAYAEVDKSRKTESANVNDNVYAVVDKKKKKDNDATAQMDVYATPVKGIGKKGKKGKGGKKKGKSVHEEAEEMNVYSNVGLENEAQQGNVYANAEETRARKKNLNKDGLLYADIAFENNNKGQRKLIIHGQENATEYIQVDFTKRADPLPDSDEEGDNV